MVDATVHVIDRGELRCDENSLPEGHTRATHGEQRPELEHGALPVHAFVIEHPAATILRDPGIHHAAAAGHWPDDLCEAFYPSASADHRLDDDLAAAGFETDDVDAVVQSHLHVDHAGGLAWFEGTRTPVYVHERELEFAYYDAVAGAGDGGYLRGDFDCDLNWAPLTRDRETHFTDFAFVHLPGHTPGTIGGMFHLEAETLLFTSDQAALPANDEAGIPPGGDFLWGETEWRASRRRLRELDRRHDATVVFGHDCGGLTGTRSP